MFAARVLLTGFVAAPVLAAPRAVVFGVWGAEPGAPVEKMTANWRQGAGAVAGFEWIKLDKTLGELQLLPGCAKLGPACRGRVAAEVGAEVLFFARHQGWGAAFEQVDVKSGTTTRKARIPIIETGEALVSIFTEAGVNFVKGGAPQPTAGATPVAAVAPKPAPAPAPVKPAAPPAATAAPVPALAEAPADPKLTRVAQLDDPELRKPEPAAVAQSPADVEVRASEPSMLSWVRPRTWVAAGVTGALIGSGVLFGVLANRAENDLNDAQRSCVTTTEVRECRDLEDKAQTRALLANILLVAGGAAAVGTGALVYLDLTATSATATVALRF